MSEEEKEAIEELKELHYGDYFCDVLLNLIDKQQKEIEELNLQNIELKKQKIIDNCSIPTQEKFNDITITLAKIK